MCGPFNAVHIWNLTLFSNGEESLDHIVLIIFSKCIMLANPPYCIFKISLSTYNNQMLFSCFIWFFSSSSLTLALSLFRNGNGGVNSSDLLLSICVGMVTSRTERAEQRQRKNDPQSKGRRKVQVQACPRSECYGGSRPQIALWRT